MAFESTWRQHETRGFRGLGALLVFTLLALLLLVATMSFLWPHHVASKTGATFDVGYVDSFKVGEPALRRTDSGVSFWLVRLDDEKFVALNAVDPRNGCTLPWRPQFVFNDRAGWFRDPCHGSTYDISGIRIYGPSQWNMDRYDVKIESHRVKVVADERFIRRTQGPDFKPVPYSTPRLNWQ